jgi:hypothetical protein
MRPVFHDDAGADYQTVATLEIVDNAVACRRWQRFCYSRFLICLSERSHRALETTMNTNAAQNVTINKLAAEAAKSSNMRIKHMFSTGPKKQNSAPEMLNAPGIIRLRHITRIAVTHLFSENQEYP